MICNCWQAFFLFCCEFKENTEPRNNLIRTAAWGGEHNTPDAQNKLIVFLFAIAMIKVIFSSGDNFCFVSDCRNLFNCKLKKLINEHTFYIWRIPTDEKFSAIIFSWYVFPFHLVQSANTELLLISFPVWEKKIFLFFLSHDIHDSHESRARGRSFFIPLYRFYPLHRHLHISRVITEESSCLHMTSGRIRAGNFWFPSANR